jgi:hypothetical protein
MGDRTIVPRVRDWLGWPSDTPLERLDAFARSGPAPVGFLLPDAASSRTLLGRLDTPRHAIDEIVGSAPTAATTPEAWWLLERLYHALVRTDGRESAPPWPAPFPTNDPLTHHFHLYVFIAAVADVVRVHGSREIAEDVTWATLRDVGLQIANYEVRHGRPGFDGAFWVWPHFRSEALTIGRLQYDRRSVPADADGSLAAHRGSPALGVHIPALGPLSPEACAASLERARKFHAVHFPEAAYEIGICESWLMDEQLASYLPEASNIVRFQQRFRIDGTWSRPADEDVIRFAFGRLPAHLDDLPQTTTLERALVTHLRSGGHWYFRRGWLDL